MKISLRIEMPGTDWSVRTDWMEGDLAKEIAHMVPQIYDVKSLVVPVNGDQMVITADVLNRCVITATQKEDK